MPSELILRTSFSGRALASAHTKSTLTPRPLFAYLSCGNSGSDLRRALFGSAVAGCLWAFWQFYPCSAIILTLSRRDPQPHCVLSTNHSQRTRWKKNMYEHHLFNVDLVSDVILLFHNLNNSLHLGRSGSTLQGYLIVKMQIHRSHGCLHFYKRTPFSSFD